MLQRFWFRSSYAQIRPRKLTKIFLCNEYEKPKQNQRRDIRAHAGFTISTSKAGLLVFRKVKQTNNVVAPQVINRISVVA